MTTREIEEVSHFHYELSDIRDKLLTGQWHFLELVLRGTRIVKQTSLRQRVLNLVHEGHPGIVGMKSRLRSKVWWPGIDKQIEMHCKSCYGCQLV